MSDLEHLVLPLIVMALVSAGSAIALVLGPAPLQVLVGVAMTSVLIAGPLVRRLGLAEDPAIDGAPFASDL